MIKQTQLTKEGLKALTDELNRLVEEKRPVIVKRLSRARSDGDLSENNDYQNAKEELDFLDGRILELEDVIKNALVVNKKSKGLVDLGTKVKLKTNGSTIVYDIVGEWEADPMEKKISHTSPLGKALFGKAPGEKVEVEAPAGKVVYEIIDID